MVDAEKDTPGLSLAASTGAIDPVEARFEDLEARIQAKDSAVMMLALQEHSTGSTTVCAGDERVAKEKAGGDETSCANSSQEHFPSKGKPPIRPGTSEPSLMDIVRKRAQQPVESSGIDLGCPMEAGHFSVGTAEPTVLSRGDASHRRPNNQSRAGAYSSTFERGLERLENATAAAVGLQPPEGPPRLRPVEQAPGLSSDHGLSQAFLVGEDASPDLEATPFDIEEANKRKAKEKEKRLKGALLLIAIFCLVVGAILASTLTSNKTDATPTMAPSDHASEAPSQVPSFAPTESLALMITNLPQFTLEKLDNSSTPQWKALHWLEEHPDLKEMEEWRKRQLFALVTFFYAMEGPHWPKVIQDRWLVYDKSECLWFSNLYGEFVEYEEDDISWWEATANLTCNENNEFQHLDLNDLGLSGYQPHIPPEISFLSSLVSLTLVRNDINAPISDFLPLEFYALTALNLINMPMNAFTGTLPSEFGLQSNLTELLLDETMLSGSIPSEVGLLTNLAQLRLSYNALSGAIPHELGSLTKMVSLSLNSNMLSGLIPSQLGSLVSLESISLDRNSLSENLPSELGLMTNLAYIDLSQNTLSGHIPTQLGELAFLNSFYITWNSLSGPIPSEFGKLISMWGIFAKMNSLSGPLPSELAGISNLEKLDLRNNTLTSTIPEELNETLNLLVLDNNNFHGTISEKVCSLGLINWDIFAGLSFSCSEQLCGCCWCPCLGANTIFNGTDCDLATEEEFDPAAQEGWPGVFPNNSYSVAINIHTDDYPQETSMEWSLEVEPGVWEVLDKADPSTPNSIWSYEKQVESNSTYRLKISDSEGDGTCCGYGLGWFTIIGSTPDQANSGTVVWSTAGDVFGSEMRVILWIDLDGTAQLLEVAHN